MLVDYSSSDDEVGDGDSGQPVAALDPVPAAARASSATTLSSLPPLPPSFHDLYAAAARASTTDDPSLHGGRQRGVPHVEGNWPSHVYLECRAGQRGRLTLGLPKQAEHDALAALLPKDGQGASLLTSPLGAPRPLHISLSSPLPVPGAAKDEFLAELRRTLPGRESGVTVVLQGARWVSNGLGSRWFYVVGAGEPDSHQALPRLLAWANRACAKFGLPQLYVDGGDFHVSIAWALAPPHDQLGPAPLQSPGLAVAFDSVKVKIGNAVTSLALGGA